MTKVPSPYPEEPFGLYSYEDRLTPYPESGVFPENEASLQALQNHSSPLPQEEAFIKARGERLLGELEEVRAIKEAYWEAQSPLYTVYAGFRTGTLHTVESTVTLPKDAFLEIGGYLLKFTSAHVELVDPEFAGVLEVVSDAMHRDRHMPLWDRGYALVLSPVEFCYSLYDSYDQWGRPEGYRSLGESLAIGASLLLLVFGARSGASRSPIKAQKLPSERAGGSGLLRGLFEYFTKRNGRGNNKPPTPEEGVPQARGRETARMRKSAEDVPTAAAKQETTSPSTKSGAQGHQAMEAKPAPRELDAPVLRNFEGQTTRLHARPGRGQKLSKTQAEQLGQGLLKEGYRIPDLYETEAGQFYEPPNYTLRDLLNEMDVSTEIRQRRMNTNSGEVTEGASGSPGLLLEDFCDLSSQNIDVHVLVRKNNGTYTHVEGTLVEVRSVKGSNGNVSEFILKNKRGDLVSVPGYQLIESQSLNAGHFIINWIFFKRS